MLIATGFPNNYPARWGEFRNRSDWVRHCNVFTRAADVNRFGARYRLAKSCSISLAGYGESTIAGYNAVVRVALCWSAFEALLLALGLTKHQVDEVSKRHDLIPLLNAMRASGKVLPFFKFVANELDSKGQRDTVLAFIEGKPCCALKLAKCIRHIFFHGTLTPNAGGSEAAHVGAACTLLSDAMFGVMEAEFNAALDRLLASPGS